MSIEFGERRPEPVFLKQEYFHSDLLGYHLVGALEGHRRTIDVVQQGLDRVLIGSKSLKEARGILEKEGFSTIHELMYVTHDSLDQILGKRAEEVKQKLEEFLIRLRVNPHQRLLEAIFGEQKNPIPPQKEKELATAVKQAFDSLPTIEKLVFNLRFGLIDGRYRTLEETAQNLKKTPERIRQIEAKALRKMRHPSRAKLLRDYLSLSEHLEEQSKSEEILRPRPEKTEAAERMVEIYPGVKVPFNKLGQVIQKIGRIIASEPTEKPKVITRLLPEIGEPIERLNLSLRVYYGLKRSGIETIFQIIELTDEEILSFRNIGNKSLAELKSKLRSYVKTKYQGFISTSQPH